MGVPSTAHGDVPLQAPFFLELRSEVVRLRPLPVGDEESNKNCRTVKICRRSKPITNFGNRWSLSPWRTNRRTLFTAPMAGESGRSLFPLVRSAQQSNQGDTPLCKSNQSGSVRARNVPIDLRERATHRWMNCDESHELPLALFAFGVSVYSRKRSNNGINRC